MYVFDTDHLGILQTRTDPEFAILSRRVLAKNPAEFYVTIISFHEQIRGWNAYLARAKDASGAVRGYAKLEQILSEFSRSQLLPFGIAAADVHDDLRRQRIRIGAMDLRIAAIAIANQMTVLTRNLVDFQRVPNLQLEDWTVSGKTSS